jgi:peptidoglycan/LPS O-acetylase OafA/YrhL
LRGIAILLVFAFHLPLDVFRTGSFGVIVFFVLSGFLITTVLLRELDRTGGVELRWFYGRRAARLFPALVFLIVGHLVLQVAVLGEPERWWDRTWPALAYVSNIVMVNGTNLAHMSHTWSLAIEEHFYLVWPLLLVWIPVRQRLAAAWGLAGIFAGWRLFQLTLGADNIRVFFSTDTNAFAPLLGCALGVTWHQRKPDFRGRNVSTMSVLALLLASTLPWEFTDRRLLYLALPVALLTAVAIWAALAAPAPWLEHPLLRWIGRLSYGLYLWHFVLIALPWERSPFPPLVAMIVTSFALAAASYYVLERPSLDWWHSFEAARRRDSSSHVLG